MKQRDLTAFQKTVRAHYARAKRDLPWRRTTIPYRILVSEIMLQQTQVDRVMPKYRSFLKRFPSVRALARAPLSDVLREWQGLGYNRRARALHACAKEIVAQHRGRIPTTYEELVPLPGIGPYTAGAVLAFAYNIPTVLIETNIRTAYLHHFFPEREGVRDAELLPYIDATLDQQQPREWYAALMDYGAHLKRTEGNANVRSRHYTKQSRFRGSDREVRGAILRALARAERPQTSATLARATGMPQVAAQLASLVRDGLVVKVRGGYRIGDTPD